MFFKPEYILILGFTIIVDYFAAIWIEQETDAKRKQLFLILSLVANLGVLAAFKYYNFFNKNLSIATHYFGYKNPLLFLKIALPLGLSFHTFQAMSYTIEVYRGNYKAERHFGLYALYVMFYPQLVAGPIERPQQVLPQLKTPHRFEYDKVVSGLRLMLWGMFKKVVIADQISTAIDPIFDHPSRNTGVSVWMAVVLFTFQIYYDFSGYSDIAVGSARVMGINLMRNFNHPYRAKSITEFWRRWHMSFSSWIRDYLYIPLGGNKVKPERMYLNLMIVFVAVGLWHGAKWPMIAYGFVNGIYVVFGLITQNIRKKIWSFTGIPKLASVNTFFQVATTFFLVCVARVLFRSECMLQSHQIYSKMIKAFIELKYVYQSRLHILSLFPKKEFWPIWIAILCWILFASSIHRIQELTNINKLFHTIPQFLRWLIYLFLIAVIFMYGQTKNNNFIYFQF